MKEWTKEQQGADSARSSSGVLGGMSKHGLISYFDFLFLLTILASMQVIVHICTWLCVCVCVCVVCVHMYMCIHFNSMCVVFVAFTTATSPPGQRGI